MEFLPIGARYGSPELRKHAVWLVQGHWGPDREACLLPWVVKMRGRHSYMEAPQDQVVFCIVSCLPDRYILEHMTVCAHDVVGPGAHLPDDPVHGPCAAVLQPWIVPWEEVAAHVL